MQRFETRLADLLAAIHGQLPRFPVRSHAAEAERGQQHLPIEVQKYGAHFCVIKDESESDYMI